MNNNNTIDEQLGKVVANYIFTTSNTSGGTYQIQPNPVINWNTTAQPVYTYPPNEELKEWAKDINLQFTTIKKLLIILFEDFQSIKGSLEKREEAEEATAT